MVIISNQYYTVQRTHQQKILVTVLSCEMTEVYWWQLKRDINALNVGDSCIFFDFMYRNGMRDRYYQIHTDNHSQIKGTLLPCHDCHDLEIIADEFFAHNPQYIATSVLSSFQKQFYLNRLRRIFNMTLDMK